MKSKWKLNFGIGGWIESTQLLVFCIIWTKQKQWWCAWMGKFSIHVDDVIINFSARCDKQKTSDDYYTASIPPNQQNTYTHKSKKHKRINLFAGFFLKGTLYSSKMIIDVSWSFALSLQETQSKSFTTLTKGRYLRHDGIPRSSIQSKLCSIWGTKPNTTK